MNEQAQDEATVAVAAARTKISTPASRRRKVFARLHGLFLLLAGGALLCGSTVQAGTTSNWSTAGWPARTAGERSAITTVIDTHETVLLLDLLRQGRRQKTEDVLFAMLGLRLMDIKDLNNGELKRFSPGEQKQLCRELGPLAKLEGSKLFASMAHRNPKQASYLRSDIATLTKSCAGI